MKTTATGDTVKTVTTHYIDGSFVESHGREVMNVIKPTNRQVIARVTLGDEEDCAYRKLHRCRNYVNSCVLLAVLKVLQIKLTTNRPEDAHWSP